MLKEEHWKRLSEKAWQARLNAYLIGKTAVGCALVTKSDILYVGCNVEHRYRCHDVHAEVNAISAMVAGGDHELKAILVVAERDRFTPCGGCMDWIMQFGGADCLVGHQKSIESPINIHTAHELMPYYPM